MSLQKEREQGSGWTVVIKLPSAKVKDERKASKKEWVSDWKNCVTATVSGEYWKDACCESGYYRNIDKQEERQRTQYSFGIDKKTRRRRVRNETMWYREEDGGWCLGKGRVRWHAACRYGMKLDWHRICVGSHVNPFINPLPFIHVGRSIVTLWLVKRISVVTSEKTGIAVHGFYHSDLKKILGVCDRTSLKRKENTKIILEK